jgi:3-hydroxybutyryl-CoA dehydrogenase
MKIAVLGTGKKLESWKQIHSSNSSITYVQDTKSCGEYDVFIDLNFDEMPKRIAEYANLNETLLVLSANLTSIDEAIHESQIQHPPKYIAGICAFPHLIERPLLEISIPHYIQNNESFNIASYKKKYESIIQFLGYQKAQWVQPRVGMVTARVICMIINEAYFTVQEGTATKTDIDTAMKLGTNYPNGPFEFKQLFGIDLVYKQLEALYNDTKDERYKICSTLKNEYLNRKS